MRFYLSAAEPHLLTKAATGAAVPLPVLTLFSPMDWEIVILDEAGEAMDCTGIAGELVVKPSANYEGEARLLIDLEADGTGDFATLTTDSVDSEQLRTDLEGTADVTFWGQIRVDLDGEEWRSKPFALRIYNSPNRPDDEAPDPASSRGYTALKTRLVAGTNITLTPNDVAETITVANSAAAYSGPALRLTGNVLEVQVGSVWRQIPTLNAGTL